MFRRSVRQPDSHNLSKRKETTRPERSIVAHLRWSYLVSSTLPLILVGILLIFLNFRTQQKNVYNEQISLASQAVREISTYVSDIETQLLSTGRHLQPHTFRTNRDEAVRELINVNFPNVRDVRVYGINTAEITHVSMEQTFSPKTYAPQTDDPLVLLALQGKGQRSDIHRGDDGQQILIVVLPLRNEERKVVGAIRAEVSVTPIAQILRLLGRGSNIVAYLVNEQHTVMVEGTVPDWKPPPQLDTILSSSTEGVEFEQGQNQIKMYQNGNDETVLGIVSPVNPGTWSVVVEQPVRVAFANVWYNMIILGTTIAFVGLIALGWALYHAQGILRPLNALREGAVEIGTGHLHHRISVTQKDELGQLATAFNQMAEQLQASLTEIEDQNRQLREGLRLARDIQMGLLPTSPPWTLDTLNVHALSIPASEVGGDFYSYLALPNGQAAISIGDISGKGVGAALFMALTSSMVESQARQTNQPSDMLTALNRLLRPRLQSNHMNAALLYAVFDLQSHTMTVANAGMIAPLLIRKNGIITQENGKTHASYHSPNPEQQTDCQFIDVGGLPIGSMHNALYRDVSISLEPGDILLFMSDGIVEAHNQHGELFGFERIEQFFVKHPHVDNLSRLIDLMLQDVQEFTGLADQHDDMTIVAVRPTMRNIDTGSRETGAIPHALRQ